MAADGGHDARVVHDLGSISAAAQKERVVEDTNIRAEFWNVNYLMH